MFSIRIFVAVILSGLLSVDIVEGRPRNHIPKSQETGKSDYEVQPEYHRLNKYGDTNTNKVYKRPSHHDIWKKIYGKREHKKGPSFRTRRRFTSSYKHHMKNKGYRGRLFGEIANGILKYLSPFSMISKRPIPQTKPNKPSETQTKSNKSSEADPTEADESISVEKFGSFLDDSEETRTQPTPTQGEDNTEELSGNSPNWWGGDKSEEAVPDSLEIENTTEDPPTLSGTLSEEEAAPDPICVSDPDAEDNEACTPDFSRATDEPDPPTSLEIENTTEDPPTVPSTTNGGSSVQILSNDLTTEKSVSTPTNGGSLVINMVVNGGAITAKPVPAPTNGGSLVINIVSNGATTEPTSTNGGSRVHILSNDAIPEPEGAEDPEGVVVVGVIDDTPPEPEPEPAQPEPAPAPDPAEPEKEVAADAATGSGCGGGGGGGKIGVKWTNLYTILTGSGDQGGGDTGDPNNGGGGGGGGAGGVTPAPAGEEDEDEGEGEGSGGGGADCGGGGGGIKVEWKPLGEVIGLWG